MRERRQDYATMAKIRLNRLPSIRDEFDQCVSFVNDKAYFCIKIDRQWYSAELTRLGEL